MWRNSHAGRRDSRGAALFVALAVVVIVMAAVLTVNARVQRALAAAAVESEGARLEQAAAGAVHAAIALLVRDKETSEVDHPLEDWAEQEKVAALASAALPEDIRVSARVTDLRSLIQVNALVVFPEGREVNPRQQALWERLLDLPIPGELRGVEQTPVTITNSLKDWLDRGDDDAVTGLSGAEAPYYASLPVPYACRNGALQSADELLLIHGISPALYRGSGDTPGLAALVTVFGASSEAEGEAGRYDGRINLNTAAPPVLAALLPESHRDLAAAIVEYRQELDPDDPLWQDPLWYHEVPGCQDLTIDPELITNASDLFRIRATAEGPSCSATLTAVAERRSAADSGKATYRILLWQPS